MPIAAIVSLVLVGLLVAALAFYLIWVVVILRSVVANLDKVLAAVRTIADRSAPIEALVTAVNEELVPVADALEDMTGQGTPARAS